MNISYNRLNYSEYFGIIREEFEFQQQLYKAQFYIIFSECIFGMVGNTIGLLVWNIGHKCHNELCSTFFKLLSATDLFATTYRLLHELDSSTYLGPDIIKSQLWCKLDLFCFNLALQLPAWIILYLSVERMLSICFPYCFDMRESRRRLKMAFSVILVGACVVNSPCLFEVAEDTFGYCNHSSADNIIKNISAVHILCVIPFCGLVITSGFTVIKLIYLKFNVHNERRTHIDTKIITRLALWTSLLQILSILPTLALEILWNERVAHGIRNTRKELWLLMFVCDISMFLNNSLNIIVYILTASYFRNNFQEIFHCQNCQDCKLLCTVNHALTSA
jgi:hypothetical protein